MAFQVRLEVGDLGKVLAGIAPCRCVPVCRVGLEDLAVGVGSRGPVAAVFGSACLSVASFQVGLALLGLQGCAGAGGESVRVGGGRVEKRKLGGYVEDSLPPARGGVVTQLRLQVGYLLQRRARLFPRCCVPVCRVGLDVSCSAFSGQAICG